MFGMCHSGLQWVAVGYSICAEVWLAGNSYVMVCSSLILVYVTIYVRTLYVHAMVFLQISNEL